MSTFQWWRADVAEWSALWETTILPGAWAWQSREGERLEWLEILTVDADFFSESKLIYILQCAKNLLMTQTGCWLVCCLMT